MKLDIFCLGILSERNYSGYELHKLINTTLSHLRQASFGALYPALTRLQVKGFVHGATEKNETSKDSLGKKNYSITESGRVHFRTELQKLTAAETINSDFLAALHFSNNLSAADVAILIDERLADLNKKQRELLKAPISEISHGQRMALRYTLGQVNAGINFLKGEGRAIQTAMARES